jgi:hypothetical protein
LGYGINRESAKISRFGKPGETEKK